MHVAQHKFNYSEGSEQQEAERIFFTLSSYVTAKVMLRRNPGEICSQLKYVVGPMLMPPPPREVTVSTSTRQDKETMLAASFLFQLDVIRLLCFDVHVSKGEAHFLLSSIWVVLFGVTERDI